MDANESVTHICLIGDDPSANLTPLADHTIPSSRLVIAHLANQESAALALKSIAKTRGLQVDTWELPDSIETEVIKLSFIELFERESKSEEQIWLNASNGTRQQVLSAYEIARSYEIPIFIVEPTYDAICWLYPEGRELTPIKDKIKLHEFFQVNECTLVSQQNQRGISKQIREIGNNWLAKANTLNSGLAKLNYLAMVAKEQNLKAKQNASMLSDDSLQWLLEDLERNDLISFNGKTVNFLSEDVRFFCNGGWLEEITFSYIRGLRSEIKTIQDDGHSVEIGRLINGKKVCNELDVVALVNNKLYVIECKTKRFENGGGSDTLYKLDSLAERLGGIKATCALVSFYPLTNAEKRRAVELGIEVFSVQELPRLKECLKQWLQTDKLDSFTK